MIIIIKIDQMCGVQSSIKFETVTEGSREVMD